MRVYWPYAKGGLGTGLGGLGIGLKVGLIISHSSVLNFWLNSLINNIKLTVYKGFRMQVLTCILKKKIKKEKR